MNTFHITAKIVDIINRRIYPGTISFSDGIITSIEENNNKIDQYILPGLIDAHIHIESSLLVPSEFARIAAVHGTVATVSDPHEIANVLGIKGVEYMIHNGSKVPFKFYFGAPSCVPATSFETSGATISTDEIKELFENYDLKYLSEMMNYPGVLNGNAETLDKINLAKILNKPIDGHAPAIRGNDAKKYIKAGISTDHECIFLEEAVEKINYGMKIMIREGSAAKNFDTLCPLIESHSDMCMLCSDDKHPDELMLGHINQIVKKALEQGYDLMNVLRAAILNPIEHYGLDVGLLRVGDDADFIMIDNFNDFNILQTFIKGIKVAENGKSLIQPVKIKLANNFNTRKKNISDFFIKPKSNNIKVIEAIDGEIITSELVRNPKINNDNLIPDIENDILKIAVVNRYVESKPAVAFIKNFGLKHGAIASSVAHDSHNIIAVGTTDREICEAVNAIITSKGGLAIFDDKEVTLLELPVAGLMSNLDYHDVSQKYSEINKKALSLGCSLKAPFMTLSFMALLVIPKLKLSDKGLFDGEKFQFIDLFS